MDKYLIRFWTKVNKTDYCWIWLDFKNKAGYGKYRIGKKIVYAHRFSYEINKGKILKGLVVDHICNNRSCVNPNHLQTITQRQNLERSPFFEGKKIYCSKGHEYSRENTYKRPKTNKRQCRTCHRIESVNYYNKMKGTQEF